MTTNFALSLSFEGIQLLHRVTGGWRIVGDADVEAADLDAVLADLRKKALALEPGGLRTKIVIPLDQIKYMALDTTRTTQEDIHAALDGTTPYSLDELVIDCERRGGRTHIAAVARETLDEAEAFARAHKFNPVAFVAIPEPFTFQSEVFFGPTAMMPEVLGAGGGVERDILPIMVVGTRIKSRLLIFDIPEEELPPSDGADLAALLAPHVDEAEPPAATGPETVEEAATDEVNAPTEDAQLAAEPDAPAPLVLSETVEEAVIPPDEAAEPEEDTVEEAEAAAAQDEAEVEPEESAYDLADAPEPEVDADVVAADAVDESNDDTPEEDETPDTVAEPDLFTVAAADEDVAAENPPPVEDTAPTDVEADGDTTEPAVEPVEATQSTAPDTVVELAPVPAAAKQPVVHAPTYPMPVDPVIAEYHTARPKYKRRARRRVVGTITAVAPASEAPTIVTTPQTPKAPVAPARQVAATTPPAGSKKLLVGTAIAASFALVGLLAWWQFSPDASDAPADLQGEPAAAVEAVDSAALDETVSQEQTPLSDVPPLVGQDDILRQTVPTPLRGDVTPVLTWAAFRPDSVTPLLDMPAPDTPLDAVPPMPAPQQTDTAQAEVGAPVLRGRVLSPDEAARIYAATGVWQRAPRIVDVPETTTAEGIIWPEVTVAPDKVAQPIAPDADVLQPEPTFVAPADPPPPNATFDLDADGFVVATEDGAVTPEGAVVFAGLPDLTLRLRPVLTEEDLARMALLAPADEDVIVVAGTPDVVPPLRPANAVLPEAEDEAPTPGAVGLAGLQPDAQTTPLVATEAAALASTTPVGPRPQLRPASLVPPPPPADLPSNPDITSVIEGIEEEAAAASFVAPTPRAIGASLRPAGRPGNFATVVASARQEQANRQAAAAAAVPQQQTAPQQAAAAPVTIPRNTGPVPGGVARAATQEDAIGLREINLIGVYGRPNNRRALVRLPNGRFVRVEIGSALDGGQVTAIGDNALNYVKRGRTYALQVPG